MNHWQVIRVEQHVRDQIRISLPLDKQWVCTYSNAFDNYRGRTPGHIQTQLLATVCVCAECVHAVAMCRAALRDYLASRVSGDVVLRLGLLHP